MHLCRTHVMRWFCVSWCCEIISADESQQCCY